MLQAKNLAANQSLRKLVNSGRVFLRFSVHRDEFLFFEVSFSLPLEFIYNDLGDSSVESILLGQLHSFETK